MSETKDETPGDAAVDGTSSEDVLDAKRAEAEDLRKQIAGEQAKQSVNIEAASRVADAARLDTEIGRLKKELDEEKAKTAVTESAITNEQGDPPTTEQGHPPTTEQGDPPTTEQGHPPTTHPPTTHRPPREQGFGKGGVK